eukprot:TRINITY_DN2505_c0_g1_i2.p1 TRINITY_DN2505_c0_g1~~TRINITY_DN2505_c0_g1_i2.p1  ORF type:complete len:242 (+),score=85.76 TRINITY_DN2505_c0_g1_i2:474-1199(+)
MKLGEKAIFTLTSEYAYGARGSPPKIPPSSTLIFEIELFDYHDSNIASITDPSRQLEVGKERKDRGKLMFQKSIYNVAENCWTQAITLFERLNRLDDGTEEQKTEGRQLLEACYLNKAIALSKLNDHESAITSCDLALNISPNSVKAHFNKGKAYLALNEFSNCIKSLETALTLSPDNVPIKKTLEFAQSKQKQIEAALRARLRNKGSNIAKNPEKKVETVSVTEEEEAKDEKIEVEENNN